MRRVFADTAYFVALVRKRDLLHRQAIYFQEHPPGQLLTTEWVLAEAGNRLAEPPTREKFIRLLAELQAQAGVEIVSVCHEHFQQGCDLYARRKDKDWSLTDCISFVIMRVMAAFDSAEQLGDTLISRVTSKKSPHNSVETDHCCHRTVQCRK